MSFPGDLHVKALVYCSVGLSHGSFQGKSPTSPLSPWGRLNTVDHHQCDDIINILKSLPRMHELTSNHISQLNIIIATTLMRPPIATRCTTTRRTAKPTKQQKPLAKNNNGKDHRSKHPLLRDHNLKIGHASFA